MKIEIRCTNEYLELPKYKRVNNKSSTILTNIDSNNMTMPKVEMSVCDRLLIGIWNEINKYYMPKGLPLKLLIC